MMRRRLGLDANPLRRRTDRVQTAARVVALLVLLLGCVGGVLTGTATYREQRGVDHRNAILGYRATGHVLSATQSGVGPNAPPRNVYRVAWLDPQENRHVGTVTTTSYRSIQSDTVTVYITAQGDLTLAPRKPGQTVALAVFEGVTTVIYVIVGTAVAYCAFLFVLDRRRRRAWAAEWASVEPQWRRQML